MAGRAHARHPEDQVRYDAARNGDLVVKRRRDEGRFRIYVAVNPEANEEPITIRDEDVRAEYPVVGVITQPRRRAARGE